MSLRDTLDPDFLAEIDESLQQLEEAVLVVEKNPSDVESINLLFRVMHTIKGSAGMFSLDTVTTFTHHLETELDKVRKNGGAVSRGLIDAILASHDLIPRMLDGDHCSEDVHDILQMLATEKKTKKETIHTELPKNDVIADVAGKKNKCFHIEFSATENFFEGTGPSPLFNEIHEAGEATIILRIDKLPSPLDESFDPQKCYLHWIINIESSLSENELADMFIFYVGKNEDLLITPMDDSYTTNPPSRLGDILIEQGIATTVNIEKALQEDGLLGTVLVAQGVATPADVKYALAEQKKRRAKSPSASEPKSTIRVDAEKLDRLVDLVGEMVTAQARLMSVSRKSIDPEIQEVAEIVETLTVGLRDQTMSIRMVPIATILGGFNRLVRDLSRDLDKVISFETEGEETELDKSVVEKLKEPLMHIIRNSADHGIESNEKRIAAGKPVEGTIKVSAYHEGAAVIVRVDDDGGGLNLEAIRKRAIERGIISAETSLPKHEIAQLICAPGFSTAEKVSNISGRGVGMDVVKKAVEALHGTLVIETEPGISTSMILRLPVTLAIIDGLMVTLDDDAFIIPLSLVEECVDLNHAEMNRIKGRDLINLRNEAVPFVRLRERLERTTKPPMREQVVITIIEGHRIGIVVDFVIGSHQTVLKPLGTVLKRAKQFSGATILGDGSVALIIDVNALVESHSEVNHSNI